MLPPLAAGRVHRRTFRVTESEREVAPGVTQSCGPSTAPRPGPCCAAGSATRFEITLVNDGTIGHSIDFHAGALAPDEPMRTIEPGERSTYRFTATRAGIWMYHCSTMPMRPTSPTACSARSSSTRRTCRPSTASTCSSSPSCTSGPDGAAADADKMRPSDPDAVVFNGYADQYDHRPLRARAGERVRIWVLDAGPNRGSAFHVVGGQFDTVYPEGAWQLRRPGDPRRRPGLRPGAGPGRVRRAGVRRGRATTRSSATSWSTPSAAPTARSG